MSWSFFALGRALVGKMGGWRRDPGRFVSCQYKTFAIFWSSFCLGELEDAATMLLCLGSKLSTEWERDWLFKSMPWVILNIYMLCRIPAYAPLGLRSPSAAMITTWSWLRPTSAPFADGTRSHCNQIGIAIAIAIATLACSRQRGWHSSQLSHAE